MSLMNIKTKSQSGFTIVELLIVVVVIAILAAITLVSFNNITNRANQSAAKETASNVQKKVELYNAEKSVYPTAVQLTASGSSTESWFTSDALFTGVENGSTHTLGQPAPDPSNGKGKVQYAPCGTAPSYTGAKITYYAFGATDGVDGATTGTKVLTLGSGC